MRDVFVHTYKMYFGKRNLYIGSGMDRAQTNIRHEWVNLDSNPEVNPDVVHDINVLPLPFKDGEFNCVFSCHTLEHAKPERFIHLVAEIHRILAPGGWFISITPYGTSDVAWGMPQHRMLFNELTWNSLDRRVYYDNNKGKYGEHDTEGLPFKNWNVAVIHLIPFTEFENDPEIEFKRKHYRNVIMEIHGVLQRVE